MENTTTLQNRLDAGKLRSGRGNWDGSSVWPNSEKSMKMQTEAKNLRMITLEDITLTFHILSKMYGAIILEDAAGNDGAIKNYMEFLERYVDMVSARMAETDNLDHKFDMKIRIASANTLMNSIARYL